MNDLPTSEWLNEHDIHCVRITAVNHDGVVLGKYLSTPKFLSILDSGTPVSDIAFGLDVGGEVAIGWDWGPWHRTSPTY